MIVFRYARWVKPDPDAIAPARGSKGFCRLSPTGTRTIVVHCKRHDSRTLRYVRNPLALNDCLEAAAYAVVGERCRQAYLHDLRGGLQELHSSVELLARAAKTLGEHAALADRAGAPAKKALINHQKSLVELLDRAIPRDEDEVAVDVGEVLRDTMRLLHNDTAAKSIAVHLDAVSGICILTMPHRCKMVFLGLSVMIIDAMPPGGALDISVGRAGALVCVEWRPASPLPAIRGPEEPWDFAAAPLSRFDLLSALAWRWTGANGGRLELPQSGHDDGSLRVLYPALLE